MYLNLHMVMFCIYIRFSWITWLINKFKYILRKGFSDLCNPCVYVQWQTWSDMRQETVRDDVGQCHVHDAWWHLPQIKISRLHVIIDTLRPYGSQSSMKFKRSHPCNDTILVLLILYIFIWNFPLKHCEQESTWSHGDLYQTCLVPSVYKLVRLFTCLFSP